MAQVFVRELNPGLIQDWINELGKYGMNCEFDPDFDFETWEEGYVPVKVEIIPGHSPADSKFSNIQMMAGLDISVIQLSEIELTDLLNFEDGENPTIEAVEKLRQCKTLIYFDEENRIRGLLNWHFFIFAIATLGVITEGILVCELMEGQLLTGSQAIAAAIKECTRIELESLKDPDRYPMTWNYHEFIQWDYPSKKEEPGDEIEEDIPY